MPGSGLSDQMVVCQERLHVNPAEMVVWLLVRLDFSGYPLMMQYKAGSKGSGIIDVSSQPFHIDFKILRCACRFRNF